MNFRYLNADEIECRVAMTKQNGVQLLLYKDARVDQRILDETVGAESWQRKHELINGNLFCSVGIWVKDLAQWVWKQDVGTESNTEAEKGQASDSFKRACFNWGIGRELYTAPFVWIGSDKTQIENINGKPRCNDRFTVKDIEINDGKITKLSIKNKAEKEVYSFGGRNTASQNQKTEKAPNRKPQKESAEQPAPMIARVGKQHIDTLLDEIKIKGVHLDGDRGILKAYNLGNIEEMNLEQWTDCIKKLQKYPDKK